MSPFVNREATEAGAKCTACPVTVPKGESPRVPKGWISDVDGLMAMVLAKVLGRSPQILPIILTGLLVHMANPED